MSSCFVPLQINDSSKSSSTFTTHLIPDLMDPFLVLLQPSTKAESVSALLAYMILQLDMPTLDMGLQVFGLGKGNVA